MTLQLIIDDVKIIKSQHKNIINFWLTKLIGDGIFVEEGVLICNEHLIDIIDDDGVVKFEGRCCKNNENVVVELIKI